MSRLLQYFVILYGIYWGFMLVGILVVRSGTRIGRKLEIFTWNSRIRLWHKQPQYQYLFKAMEDKRYITASLLVMLFNLPMVVVQYAIGLILLSPLMAAYAGSLVGLITGQGRGKAFFVYTVFTLIFEFGAFATAGAIGMMAGELWLLSDKSFFDSFGIVMEQISIYTFLPLFCLLLNGLIEATGPYFGIEGVPGIEAYRKQIFK